MEVRTNITGSASVQIVSDPDGVNPSDVFELVVTALEETRPGGAPRYRLEVRIGDEDDFAAHEDDAPSYPETIVDTVVVSGEYHHDRSLLTAFDRLAGDLSALRDMVEAESQPDVLDRLDNALDRFDETRNMVKED